MNYGSFINILDTQIPIAIKTAESFSQGKSIFSYDKTNKVAEAYFSFAKELLNNERNKTKNARSFVKRNLRNNYSLIYLSFVFFLNKWRIIVIFYVLL